MAQFAAFCNIKKNFHSGHAPPDPPNLLRIFGTRRCWPPPMRTSGAACVSSGAPHEVSAMTAKIFDLASSLVSLAGTMHTGTLYCRLIILPVISLKKNRINILGWHHCNGNRAQVPITLHEHQSFAKRKWMFSVVLDLPQYKEIFSQIDNLHAPTKVLCVWYSVIKDTICQ